MSVQKPSGSTARFARYQAEQAKQNRRQKNFRNDPKSQGNKQNDYIKPDPLKPQS